MRFQSFEKNGEKMFEKVLTSEKMFGIIMIQGSNNRSEHSCVFLQERSGVIMNREYTEGKKKYINHRRRQMIFRRICLISAILLSTLTLIFTAGILSHAEEGDEIHFYRYYTSVTVMPGDTLSSIADDYGFNYEDTETHVEEIMFCNHLTDDLIYPGSSLIVPYYSTEFIY